ncbi:hypothetical protein B9479_003886 [Cryptococcus floricola]|uniref:Transcription factor IIIC subunit 5 HTH domain-containing protein n=1 Tax=Cryptococcus floricola TaxID=2591691 RepID=A0A5D3AZ65_9TREE|nr:hypothetical protein B9479_003886 [Cryptococcus floricola]
MSQEASTSTASTAKEAPTHSIPKQAYTSIEYPGPVSHPSSILQYCSQETINECFNAPPAVRASLEVRFRGDEAGPPVRGTRSQRAKLLVKVVRRRKKTSGRGGDKPEGGVFKLETMGSIGSTVRFVAMADHHWTPDSEGPTASIIKALKNLDYNAILDYSYTPLDENYVEANPDTSDPDIPFRSRLDLQPPPMFSTRAVPSTFNYKLPTTVVAQQTTHPITGAPRTRYVNTSRKTGYAPQIMQHEHTLGDVPQQPNEQVQQDAAKGLDKALLSRLKELFEQRKVWGREALMSELTERERRLVKNNKAYVPSVAYVITTGVYYKCLVKYGYDPRLDPESRCWQKMAFYAHKQTIKNPITRPDDEEEVDRQKGWWDDEQERLIADGARPPLNPWKVHIFDGQVLNRERADYQLCDITDPFISKYIENTDHLSKTCSVKSGWYTFSYFTLLKGLVRAKYMYLWENGQPAPDEVCRPVLEEWEKGRLGSTRDEDEEEGMDEEETLNTGSIEPGRELEFQSDSESDSESDVNAGGRGEDGDRSDDAEEDQGDE